MRRRRHHRHCPAVSRAFRLAHAPDHPRPRRAPQRLGPHRRAAQREARAVHRGEPGREQRGERVPGEVAPGEAPLLQRVKGGLRERDEG